MRIFDSVLLFLIVSFANAGGSSKGKKSKKSKSPSNQSSSSTLSESTTTTNYTSTTITCCTTSSSTSSTDASTTSTTSSLAATEKKPVYSNPVTLYKNEVGALTTKAMKESKKTNFLSCNDGVCQKKSLDQIVADHAIYISDACKLGEIFSKLINIIKEIIPIIPNARIDHKRDAALFQEMLEKRLNLEFPACAQNPERFLSFDFADILDLSVDDVIAYSEFLKLLMEQGNRKVSLPAVYMLNAFLQLDSMQHELLKNHKAEELELILAARNKLLEIARKKAHYETVCNIISVPLSKSVREFVKRHSTNAFCVTHALDTVDAIVSKGAIPELRAYFFAKGISAFLLTDDVAQLEFCNDEDIMIREPYSTSDISLWLADVISFMHISFTRIHSILETALVSGNRKFVYHIAEYFVSASWITVFKGLTFDQKISISSDLTFKPYLVMCFMMATFQPLQLQNNFGKLRLIDCLNGDANQRAQCVFNLIVRTFATLEFPRTSGELQDLINFLFKGYDKLKFQNEAISKKLHGNVHKMIIESVGGEFNEIFILNLMSTGLDVLNEFANNYFFAFPGKSTKVPKEVHQYGRVLRKSFSRRKFMLRGHDSFKILRIAEDPNGLKHLHVTAAQLLIIPSTSSAEMFSRFHTYQSLNKFASDLPIVCEFWERFARVKQCRTEEQSQLGKVDSMATILCTNPLLFSSPSLQPIFAEIIQKAFCESTHVIGNIAAFVWDYYATTGIDVSCFMNAFKLSDGICIYDIFFPPLYLRPLESEASLNFLKIGDYLCMAMMSIMRVVRDKSQDAPKIYHTFIRHLPAIIELFLGDEEIESYLYHSVIITISRAFTSCLPEVRKTHLGPHWTQKWMIESLELLDSSVIGAISCDPENYGPFALFSLMSRPGKDFLFDNIKSIPKNHNFIVEYLEHGKLNDENFTKANTDYFYVFIMEALVMAPKNLKIELSNHQIVIPKDFNDHVIMRLQFMFNPYFDFEDGDLETYALHKCSTHRKIVHGMVKAIFNSENPGIFTVLVQILYEHYKSCKTRLATPTKDIKKETLESLILDADNEYLKHHLKQLPLTNPQLYTDGLNTPLSSKDSPVEEEGHKSAISSERVQESNTNNKTKPIANNSNEINKGNHNQKKIGKEDVDAEVDYFYSTPTPKKQVQEVTHLEDNIAVYFSPSGDGSLKPNSSLKPGTHILLLKHANNNGFSFLLDESFYNFLVDEEYKVDMKSFGSQLELWEEAKEKVPLKDGRSRLKLWVPKDSGNINIAKGSILRAELEKFLIENAELRNRLCSLLQYSMQGTNSLRQITVKPTSIPKQRVKIQNGTLFLDSSVTAKTLSDTLKNFLSLQPPSPQEEKQQVVKEEASKTENQIVNETTTLPQTFLKSEEETETSLPATTVTYLGDDNFMAYEGQVQEITCDASTQLSRIDNYLASNSHDQTLQKMKHELQSVAVDSTVQTRLNELRTLIMNADYIAVDFELTGVSLNNGSDPSGFDECKQSIQQNLIVQVGLMLMKKSESGSLVQENSGKSIWKIPVFMNGNTDDSIWRKNSLNFLIGNGFDLLAWKVQCLEYSQLDDIWKALLEKPILTHNGLLDVLHLLRAAGRFSEVGNVHSTDEFKEFLNIVGIIVYDTRVLYIQTHPHFSLAKLSEAVLPRDKLKEGSAHDASYDAYCTGHLCRRFTTAIMSESKNILLETKRGTRKMESGENNSSTLQSPRNIFADAPTRPNAARRIPKPPQNQKSLSNSSSLAALSSRTFQEFIPNPHYHQQSASHYAPPLQQQQTYYNGQSLNSPRNMMQKSQTDQPPTIRWPLRFQQNSFPLNGTAQNSTEKKN